MSHLARLRHHSRAALAEAAADLAALIWPGPCFACGDDLGRGARAGACAACWAALPLHSGSGCPRCDLPGPWDSAADCPDCARHATAAAAAAASSASAAAAADPLRRIIAAARYEEPLVALHRRLKFGGAFDLVDPLAAQMATAWRGRGSGAIDLVVPVPPDPRRWTPRRRVPSRLAAAVAADLGAPAALRALQKIRSTRPLTDRGGDERRRALVGAYRVRDPELVAEASILVVDDIATTGATLREAARALADAGAAAIAALVLARTPLGR